MRPLIAGATRPCAFGIEGLYHEILDDPVKHCSIIEAVTGQKNKVVYRLRRAIREEVYLDVATIRVKHSLIFFLGINHHIRWLRIALCHYISLLHVTSNSGRDCT